MFNVYMDILSRSIQLHRQSMCCSVGGTVVSHMLYADEIVLSVPSAKGMQTIFYSAVIRPFKLTLQNLVSWTLTPEKLVIRS